MVQKPASIVPIRYTPFIGVLFNTQMAGEDVKLAMQEHNLKAAGSGELKHFEQLFKRNPKCCQQPLVFLEAVTPSYWGDRISVACKYTHIDKTHNHTSHVLHINDQWFGLYWRPRVMFVAVPT